MVGTALAMLIRPLPALRPSMPISKNPFGGVFKSIRELRTDRRVFQVLLLNSLFWFNGGVVQQALVGLGAPSYLDIPKQENWRLSLLLVVLAIAIITGSLCVPPVARRIRPGKLVAFGAISMLVSQAILASAIWALGARAYGLSIALVAVLGGTGAFFAVPVQTFLQDAPEQGTRGKTFAVNNFMNFAFIFLAGGFYLGSSVLRLSPGLAATVSAALMCSVLGLFRKSVLSIEQPSGSPS
jgi:MFS family permease